jgi:hypothetical protein
MGKSVKIIIIAFTVLFSIIAFYQILIGNPFSDPVSPVVIFVLAFLMGVLGIIALIREGKAKKSKK